ncbi:MAG: N-acetyl-alpha-D-glucosaminyl L-malate synthase BshA [Flavobacteriales bacterium]|nr:N-acetyl-alpha-D-glucosaminyl L-malate synthase BshA [Flavobacteriales bacterium]
MSDSPTTGLRVGIVCYPTFGGSGVVATELGKALAMQGHEVHFITYNQPVRLGSFHPGVYYHEVEVSKYPLFEYPPYELVLTSKMVEVVQTHNLNLLHVHYAIPHASAAVNAKCILADAGLTVPVVTTLHGTDITLLGKDASFKPVITHAINASDVVTTVSQSLKDDTARLFEVSRDVEVVHNFVCPSHFERPPDLEFRSQLSPKGTPILCHVSNFRPVKRVLDVIDTFARVRAEREVTLLMVGDGPDRARAEARCRELDLAQDVVFLGKVKNPIEPLLISDLLLLPSETESFGLVALEAMAAGVPVVSSNVGGLSEVNVQEETGFLRDVGDVEGMAQDALAILDDGALRGFKQRAKARAAEFTIDRILPHYLDLYHRALDSSAS